MTLDHMKHYKPLILADYHFCAPNHNKKRVLKKSLSAKKKVYGFAKFEWNCTSKYKNNGSINIRNIQNIKLLEKGEGEWNF